MIQYLMLEYNIKRPNSQLTPNQMQPFNPNRKFQELLQQDHEKKIYFFIFITTFSILYIFFIHLQLKRINFDTFINLSEMMQLLGQSQFILTSSISWNLQVIEIQNRQYNHRKGIDYMFLVLDILLLFNSINNLDFQQIKNFKTNLIMLKQTTGSLTTWSNLKPYSYLFAAVDYQDNLSFVKFHSFDLAQKDTSTSQLGEIKVQGLITSLAWDNYALDLYQQGIIAGGLDDGTVYIWDAYQAIQVRLDTSIKSMKLRQQQWNSIPSNPIYQHWEDRMFQSWIQLRDLKIHPYTVQENQIYEDSPITSVSWNKKVQHILASAYQNGVTVVWDLKTNKSIFNFQDSSAICNRKVSLSWNPQIPTQMAVTYDDERVPELQIWDLRNPQGPVIVFNQAHKEGINCLSWCPSDHSLLLTAGRDNQVICWNYKTQSIVSQVQLDFEIIDLNWSKKVNSIYSVSSSDGQTLIMSMGGSKEGYAPKWYKPPVGTAFSVSGDLASFRESSTNIKITKQNVKDHQDVFKGFNQFMETETVQEKLELQREQYPELIKLISCMAKGDRESLLQTLGFSAQEITQQTENYTGKRHQKKEEINRRRAQTKQKVTVDFTSISEQEAESFFDSLTNQSIKKLEQPKQQIQDKREIYQYDQVSRNTNWDVGVERIIKDNLIIGNYEGAIDCALKSGRAAEALLLAYSQGKDMFESTMSTFLTSQTDYFLKNLIKHIVLKQPEEIAKNYELNNWKEVAAMVHQNDVNSFKILQALGDRFINERKDENSALQYYILARNSEKAIKILSKQATTLKQLAETIKLLLLIEDISLESTDEFIIQLNQLLYRFAQNAVSNGQYLAAAHALQYTSDDYYPAQELFHLISNGNTPDRDNIHKLYNVPNLPFKVGVVKQGVIKQKTSQKEDPVSKPTQPIKKGQIGNPFPSQPQSGTGSQPIRQDPIQAPQEKRRPPPPAPIHQAIQQQNPKQPNLIQKVSDPIPTNKNKRINKQLKILHLVLNLSNNTKNSQNNKLFKRLLKFNNNLNKLYNSHKEEDHHHHHHQEEMFHHHPRNEVYIYKYKILIDISINIIFYYDIDFYILIFLFIKFNIYNVNKSQQCQSVQGDIKPRKKL
ncbi:hypothetical protein pb186bvf_015526 [Paramecium bursaria]